MTRWGCGLGSSAGTPRPGPLHFPPHTSKGVGWGDVAKTTTAGSGPDSLPAALGSKGSRDVPGLEGGTLVPSSPLILSQKEGGGNQRQGETGEASRVSWGMEVQRALLTLALGRARGPGVLPGNLNCGLDSLRQGQADCWGEFAG